MVTVRKVIVIPLAILLFAALALAACDELGNSNSGNAASVPSSVPDLWIVSGSENRALEPITQEWAGEQGTIIQVDYLGSLDGRPRLKCV